MDSQQIAPLFTTLHINLEDQNLLESTREGDLFAVKTMLDQGANAGAREAVSGMTPLMVAAQCGHHHIVWDLLHRFPSQYLPEHWHQNTYGTNEDTRVRFLEDLAFARSSEGWAPIHYAADGGHLRVVHHLFSIAQVDLDDETDEIAGAEVLTPILLAVAKGHLRVANYIAKDRSSSSLANGLDYAVKHGDISLMEGLAETLMTTIQYAFEHGNVEFMKGLVTVLRKTIRDAFEHGEIDLIEVLSAGIRTAAHKASRPSDVVAMEAVLRTTIRYLQRLS